MTVVIETSLGSLRGEQRDRCTRFLGIPFAAPPVGRRRFRAPEPATPWPGVRDASAYGATPPQATTPMLDRLGMATPGPHDEDCLTINAWTPSVAGRRPVLLWIHGGAYMNGGGNSPLFDGQRLATLGDCVVATLNYRVGALGFLFLGATALEADANPGLLDQVAALRWLRENAAALGGDPGNVTVFGESAGAGSICALLAVPAARGLFRRAIVQSASPDGVIDPDDASWRRELLLDALGVDVAGLARVPAEELVRAAGRCASERSYKTGMFFAPVVDGLVLPTRPSEAVAAGDAKEVELVIGTTRDELQLYKFDVAPPNMSDEVLAAALSSQIPGEAPDGRPLGAVLAERYRAIRSARGESTDAMDLIFAVQTDLAMWIPSVGLATHQARVQPHTFMYRFDWRSPAQGGALGACHALDVPFALGNLDAPGVADFAGSGAAARQLADAIGSAWTAFAHTGDPSHAGIGDWPAYEGDGRQTLMLDATCRVEADPHAEERLLFEELSLAPRPNPEGDRP